MADTCELVSITKSRAQYTTWNKVYHVTLEEPGTLDDAEDALSESYGSEYEGCTCIQVDGNIVVMEEDADLSHEFEFTLAFSNEPRLIEGAVDPLDLDARVGFAPREVTEVMEKDESDPPKRLENTAYDKFDPAPEQTNYCLAINIRKNVAAYTLTHFSWIGCVNDDDVVIRGVTYAAGKLLCVETSGDEQDHPNGIDRYVPLQVSLIANRKGWDLKLYSIGYNHISEGNKYPILDEVQQPISAPYPLLENGAAAASDSTEPFIMTFKPHAEIDFSAIEDLLD